MQDLCRLDLKQISKMIGSTIQLVSECWNSAQEPSTPPLWVPANSHLDSLCSRETVNARDSQQSQWAPYAIIYKDSVLSLSFSKTENKTHIHCVSAS